MRALLLAFLALFIAVPLTACAGIPTGPAAVAQLTKADELTAVGAQLTYKTWRLAVELGVQTGRIKGATATRVRELDTELYRYLQLSEQAYEAGNAATFHAAIDKFNGVHATANAVLTGSQ